jgi:hypothetical protein
VAGFQSFSVQRFSVWRLLKWVALLWLINLIVLGPFTAAVATLAGAQHRLRIDAIPWFTAVLWAPLVEEMVFRYSLRRPQQVGWVLPCMLWPLLSGPGRVSAILVMAVLLLVVYTNRIQRSPRRRWRWAWRRCYVRHFPWIVHLLALVFAGMHLGNFSFNRTSLWWMPLLVLPQWLTGLVLSWVRVSSGIFASIVMHISFNGGLSLVLIALQWALLE